MAAPLLLWSCSMATCSRVELRGPGLWRGGADLPVFSKQSKTNEEKGKIEIGLR